ncbi:MAG: HpcH/HpaI aldolase family protein [Phenylobacterium sp.]
MSLKAQIAGAQPVLGTFVKTPHPHIVEVLATSGLDCVCLDAEHAPFDRGDLDRCILAARATSFPVLVRTPTGAPQDILNALDCGADGVVVPHVRSAADARAVAACAHYGARGSLPSRGYAGSSRAAGYGGSSIPQHLSSSAEKTVVVAQIEDLEALDCIEEIAAVDGIDVLFIGRIDLTVALGCTSPDDPRVIAAVEQVLAAATRAGRPAGMFTPRAEDVPDWRRKGAAFFLLGSDHVFIRSGAMALRTQAGL